MKVFVWFVALSVLCSCATIVNKPYVETRISSYTESVFVIISNIDTVSCTDASINLKRNSKDISESIKGVDKEMPVVKNINQEGINLYFSLPHINHYFTRTEFAYDNRLVFFGISCGFEYYLNENKYLSFQFGAATDLWLPILAPINIE